MSYITSARDRNDNQSQTSRQTNQTQQSSNRSQASSQASSVSSQAPSTRSQALSIRSQYSINTDIPSDNPPAVGRYTVLGCTAFANPDTIVPRNRRGQFQLTRPPNARNPFGVRPHVEDYPFPPVADLDQFSDPQHEPFKAWVQDPENPRELIPLDKDLYLMRLPWACGWDNANNAINGGARCKCTDCRPGGCRFETAQVVWYWGFCEKCYYRCQKMTGLLSPNEHGQGMPGGEDRDRGSGSPSHRSSRSGRSEAGSHHSSRSHRSGRSGKGSSFLDFFRGR